VGFWNFPNRDLSLQVEIERFQIARNLEDFDQDCLFANGLGVFKNPAPVQFCCKTVLDRLTSSPSMYGKSCDLARYCATVLLPQPAGPVTMKRCLCTGREIALPMVGSGRGIDGVESGAERTER
jgi:hypothetical protein